MFKDALERLETERGRRSKVKRLSQSRNKTSISAVSEILIFFTLAYLADHIHNRRKLSRLQ
jgi:hypothetical protein